MNKTHSKIQVQNRKTEKPRKPWEIEAKVFPLWRKSVKIKGMERVGTIFGEKHSNVTTGKLGSISLDRIDVNLKYFKREKNQFSKSPIRISKLETFGRASAWSGLIEWIHLQNSFTNTPFFSQMKNTVEGKKPFQKVFSKSAKEYSSENVF